MARHFNPADVDSVKTDFGFAHGRKESGMTFSMRRNRRRLRRETRAI